MVVHIEQADSYQTTLLSLASKSRQDFIREYKNYDEDSGRGVYLQVLAELTKAIREENVGSLKKLSKLIEHIGDVKTQVTLREYYNNSSNPIRSTNLVILACKHNKVDILKTIFNNSKILDNLSIDIGKDAIASNDKDETCNDAFYYAIRSNNVELLETLINMWPNDYFATCSEELDEVLSKSYENLKLKNVPLSEEIEFFVENKLINLRFFSKSLKHVQKAKYDIYNIRERINLVLENIALLKAEYLNEKKVDEQFLFTAKFIAQNIHVLKRQLKSTYDRLPWEEIEFCVVSFVLCHTKRQEINLFYRSTLNKSRILNHLENFAKELEGATVIIENMNIGKLSELPKVKREKVITEIVCNFPQFEELYKDYQQIRDVLSLEKINNYINLASSVDPKEREGQLVITRSLQVIGENLKNTLESPKLSNTTSELLILSLPRNTREIIIDLRNSISHANALAKRTEIEENMGINFFVGVQNDTKKVGVVITDILYKKKIKMVRLLLEKIVNSKHFYEIEEVAKVLSIIDLDKMNAVDLEILEHEKLEKLVKYLSDTIIDKTNYEKEMFENINQIMNRAGASFEIKTADYITGLSYLCCLTSILNEVNVDHNVIREIKFSANQTLLNMTSKIEHRSLKEIADMSVKILKSVESKLEYENLNIAKKLIFEILYIAEFETGDIKYIEELRSKLKEISSYIPLDKQRMTYNSIQEKYNKQLTLKLSELKDILSQKLLIGKSNEKLSFYKKDKKLQAVVEMLVLDIMSILGSSKNRLENNMLFLDDHTPLLNGKCLRNHLAHDNALVDLLFSDPAIIVLLNAKKLTEENVIISKQRLGKLLNDDPFKLKEKFYQVLVNITYQNRMFVAVEEGNLESFKDFLQKGADINARSIYSWTTLHYAAKGPSLEAMKFIIDQSSSLNVKDTNGQSPLHVAASYGRKNLIKVLVKEADFDVHDVDNNGKTPLHVAAQNGYKDTVVFLLENEARTTIRDKFGLSPLHYAIKNNCIEITKILVAKESNVDSNEAMDGLTPLHEAAEFGHREIVNFLLENKANINVRNDHDLTPLHAAARNGHLEVVKALILNGADVNARVLNGCTPLHYAVINGYEKNARILLKNGANVNATDKSYKFTPLHFASKDGYVEIVTILLKNKANSSVETFEGLTPLHLAAQSNHLEIVTALIQHGVSLHTKDKSNSTPFHYAVKNCHKEMTELLIKYGAEVNDKADNDITPLHLATAKGNHSIVDLLIRNKAIINAQDIGGRAPLHTAAENGNIAVLELLIENNADINQKNNKGLMPLHIAAQKGHLDAIVYLIQNNAEVNAEANNGSTPLLLAVVGGHNAVVSLLIENKAKINAKDVFGVTLLHRAVNFGHKEIVEILVTNGANINVQCNKSTPLLCAIKCNNKEIVEILIEKGANVNAGDGGPLSLAALAGFRDIVEVLLKNKARVNMKGPENYTALHSAATKGHKEIVNALIKSGADVNAMTIRNKSPLWVAAQEGYDEVVVILIKNGADVNFKTFEGTPLHIAAGRGHCSVVIELLKNGAKTVIKDCKNRTPLELAVANGHLEIVESLLRYKKVDMNLAGNDNFTILHIASQEGYLEIVKYLVAEGSDINAKIVSDSKPIHMAARNGHKAIVEFFLSKGLTINESGASNQTLLHYAALDGQLEVVKYLISKHADVNAQTVKGLSPIHLAGRKGHKEVIEVLLRNGAVYNAVDKIGRIPLQMSTNENVINLLASTEKLFTAVSHNNYSEVESCIKAGAFVNAKNVDGATPLHYAARKGFDAVVNVLLENKADPNLSNNNGMTPLHYAAKLSHLKVTLALLTNSAVYNPVGDSGKTPLDLSADQRITSILKLVGESFENIKNGNSNFIYILNRIKDIDTIKAIMGARNKENETLVVAAVHSNYSRLEQLKQISQGDIASQINKAEELLHQGDYQKAIAIFKSAFENRKEILGPSNPGTLDIQINIAKAVHSQGSFQEALNIFKDIFQKQREMLGITNKDTLSTRSMIALVLLTQGKDEKALNMFQEVYRMQNEILGPNHSDTLDTQFNMALVLNVQGKYEEALSLNMAVFEKRKEISGANDPGTLNSQSNIAMVLANQGKHEEALKIYKEVFEKCKVVFGMDHRATLSTIKQIANVLSDQERYPKALQSHQEVFSIQKKMLGPFHPDTLNTQYIMANILLKQGKLIGALKAFTECLDKTQAVFGSSHHIVLDIVKKLEHIKKNLKIDGFTESQILQHLQKDINIAVINGDIETVQRLIKDGADVNDKDIDGRAPLHYAVSSRRIDIVKILLKAGADVTQVTHKGKTPLHTATSNGYKEAVDVLLHQVKRDKLNDFVNAKTTATGTTSLHVAVKSGYFEIVKSLLKHGANYDIQNKENKIPLYFSQEQNITDLLNLTEELFKDAKYSKLENINKLKTFKSDEVLAMTNARNNQGNTLLQVAIINKNKHFASKLLEILKRIRCGLKV